LRSLAKRIVQIDAKGKAFRSLYWVKVFLRAKCGEMQGFVAATSSAALKASSAVLNLKFI
jgi:hypothetical protein